MFSTLGKSNHVHLYLFTGLITLSLGRDGCGLQRLYKASLKDPHSLFSRVQTCWDWSWLHCGNFGKFLRGRGEQLKLNWILQSYLQHRSRTFINCTQWWVLIKVDEILLCSLRNETLMVIIDRNVIFFSVSSICMYAIHQAFIPFGICKQVMSFIHIISSNFLIKCG